MVIFRFFLASLAKVFEVMLSINDRLHTSLFPASTAGSGAWNQPSTVSTEALEAQQPGRPPLVIYEPSTPAERWPEVPAQATVEDCRPGESLIAFRAMERCLLSQPTGAQLDASDLGRASILEIHRCGAVEDPLARYRHLEDAALLLSARRGSIAAALRAVGTNSLGARRVELSDSSPSASTWWTQQTSLAGKSVASVEVCVGF